MQRTLAFKGNRRGPSIWFPANQSDRAAALRTARRGPTGEIKAESQGPLRRGPAKCQGTPRFKHAGLGVKWGPKFTRLTKVFGLLVSDAEPSCPAG